jgi:hypothetical protein
MRRHPPILSLPPALVRSLSLFHPKRHLIPYRSNSFMARAKNARRSLRHYFSIFPRNNADAYAQSLLIMMRHRIFMITRKRAQTKMRYYLNGLLPHCFHSTRSALVGGRRPRQFSYSPLFVSACQPLPSSAILCRPLPSSAVLCRPLPCVAGDRSIEPIFVGGAQATLI